MGHADVGTTQMYTGAPTLDELAKRRRPESNRCTRLCRPLRSHSATAPGASHILGRAAFTTIPVGFVAHYESSPDAEAAMARFTPDPSFYASPGAAAAAPPEEARVRRHAQHGHERRPRAGRAHACSTSRRARRRTAQLVGRLDMPNVGDELHHFGWNACSSALCPWAPHPHVERRYLLVPGPALVAHPRPRRQGRPARPEDRQGDRGRGDRAQGRLQPPAHGPLRPGRDLRLRARRPRRRRAGRHLPARPRRLRGQGRLGGRPRAAGARLRLLVAPRPTTR